MGDRGLIQKHNCFYDSVARIPFIVSWQGGIEQARSEELVELADLMPTVLELCRIEGSAGMQGANVADVLLGKVASVKDAALIESGEKGEPVRLAVLRREGQLLEGTSFAWCAFREAWVGKGKALVSADWLTLSRGVLAALPMLLPPTLGRSGEQWRARGPLRRRCR